MIPGELCISNVILFQDTYKCPFVFFISPQIVALTGFPRNRPALIDFVSSITKKQSLLVCGHIFMVRYINSFSSIHNCTYCEQGD